MIDDAMIKRLAAQCGFAWNYGDFNMPACVEASERELSAFARACYAAGQRDKAEECKQICIDERVGLNEDNPNEGDEAYNLALIHVFNAIAERARTEEAKP